VVYFEFLERGRYPEKDINLDHIFLTASIMISSGLLWCIWQYLFKMIQMLHMVATFHNSVSFHLNKTLMVNSFLQWKLGTSDFKQIYFCKELKVEDMLV